MLRKIWYVAEKDLLQLTKDHAGLVWLIVIPLALMGVLGSLVSGISSSSAAVRATLPVLNQDGGPGSLALIDALRQMPTLSVQLVSDETATKQAVRDGDQAGLLIIPSGFSAALQSPHPAAHVTYFSVSGNSDLRAAIAASSVQDAVQRFSWASVTSAAVSAAQRQGTGRVNPALTAQLTAQASTQLDQAPPVALQTVNASGTTNPQDQTVPGYALMFALFGITGGAGSLLEEKESGTVKRLLIAPLPPFALLGGKALALFVQSVAQLALLFGLGALLFKIDLGSSPLALALLIVGTSLAATGLGMILVSFVRTQRQLRPITTLVTLGFSAIGGSWFPIALEPQWMQTVSKVSLNAWAMQGFTGLMIFGKGFSQVLPDIAVLFLYGAVAFAIGVRLFRFREA